MGGKDTSDLSSPCFLPSPDYERNAENDFCLGRKDTLPWPYPIIYTCMHATANRWTPNLLETGNWWRWESGRRLNPAPPTTRQLVSTTTGFLKVICTCNTSSCSSRRRTIHVCPFTSRQGKRCGKLFSPCPFSQLNPPEQGMQVHSSQLNEKLHIREK